MSRRLTVALLALAACLLHALISWPRALVLAFFVGGACLAFAAEALGVALGLLRHHTHPQIRGVPVHVIAAWPVFAYVAYGLARLVLPVGTLAVLAAAVFATLFDLTIDHRGLAHGEWSYPDHPLSARRFRGVPWWNYAAWLVLVALTTSIPALAWGR